MMLAFFNGKRFLARFLIAAVLVLVADAQENQPTSGTVIHAISPPAIFVPNNGKQAIAIIKGSGLEKIQSTVVMRNGKLVPPILTRLGPISEGRAQLYVMAAPPTPLGGDYQLKLNTPQGSLLAKLKIEVVAGDDPRASQTVVQDVSSLPRTEDRPAVVFADPKTVPTVTETVPSPLSIKADGISQKIILKGSNLERITEIRVRRSEKSSVYAAGMGKLPFEKTLDGGIALELSASEGTPLGRRYALDLIVGDYVAASVLVEVIAP